MSTDKKFLPMSRTELDPSETTDFDLIIISGDAYIDHPSFGTAIIARTLEADGFTVGIIAQPDWNDVEAFRTLGRPKLAWLISSGAIDSMVAHYTVNRKLRSSDALTPGGKPHARPDRAVITYTSKVRQAYKHVPVILGGLEASLRRLSHYDYWSDTIRKSILLDSKADLILYGMAERNSVEVCRRLRAGEDISSITDVRGTVFKRSPVNDARSTPFPEFRLPDWDQVSQRDKSANTGTTTGKRSYALSIQQRLLHENPMKPVRLVEDYGFCEVVQNPPSLPLSQQEMDTVYELGFTRKAHPSYRNTGVIPALAEVSFSITSTRGCFGGCTFCAITSHQGRIIQARSTPSLIFEAEKLTRDRDFKGYIHDVGGPTANFRVPACAKQSTLGPCEHRECLFPEPCPQLQEDHEGYLEILKQIQEIPHVKKVFIRSGIRYDYLLNTASPETQKRFIRQLCEHHVSGQLKVAPEHACASALDIMGKPPIELFDEFARRFKLENDRLKKRQYIIGYFISSHPGATLEDAIELACYLKKRGFIPDQVQDFYPTPGTVASCIYYTGMDPRPGNDFREVHVPKGREKSLQRALIHFHKPENYNLVREALIKCAREDLIGSGPDCLIKSRKHSSRRKSRA